MLHLLRSRHLIAAAAVFCVPLLAGAQATTTKPTAAKAVTSDQASTPTHTQTPRAATQTATPASPTAKAVSHPTTTAKIVTATCKDGTAYSGASRKGACSSHGGVKFWGAGVSATCNDGTAFQGKSRKGACAKHGGVKEWKKAA